MKLNELKNIIREVLEGEYSSENKNETIKRFLNVARKMHQDMNNLVFLWEKIEQTGTSPSDISGYPFNLSLNELVLEVSNWVDNLEGFYENEINEKALSRSQQQTLQESQFYYVNKLKTQGMTSSGSFTRDKNRWMLFSKDEIDNFISNKKKPYGSAKNGIFISALNEKALSRSQQQAMGVAYSAKKGDMPVSKLKGASKEMHNSMTKKELEDFASTKHKGLPKKVAKKK